jgi:hypothetical protein
VDVTKEELVDLCRSPNIATDVMGWTWILDEGRKKSVQHFGGDTSWKRSRGSSVSIVSTGWTMEVRFPTGAEDFSSRPCVQTGSGANPASYPMGTGGPFPGGKARPGRDADHSPPSSAEVRNE